MSLTVAVMLQQVLQSCQPSRNRCAKGTLVAISSRRREGSLSAPSRPVVVARSTIETRLQAAESRLTPGRRRLVQATLDSSDETHFLSSRALARRFKVDPATIVRTIQVLGY